MKPPCSVLIGCLMLVGSAAFVSVAGAQSPATPTYLNAEVVAVDPVNRTLVIRNAQQAEETVELDDTVGGLGDIKAGDRVILAMRGEPGRNRVSAIQKSTTQAPDKPAGPAQKPPAVKAASPKSVRGPLPALGNANATAAFSERVASLAAQAARVDSLWTGFRSNCDVTLARPYEGAREWFAIWDDQVRADLSSGFCRDLFNQIVGQGEPLKRSMVAAEDAARKELSPGTIRQIRRRYAMDWEGWDLPAPDRLEL